RQTKNPRLFAVGLVFRVVKTSLSDRLGDHLTERRPFFFQTLVLDLFELRRRDLEFLGHDFIRFPHVMNIVLGGNQGLEYFFPLGNGQAFAAHRSSFRTGAQMGLFSHSPKSVYEENFPSNQKFPVFSMAPNNAARTLLI